MTTRVVLLGAGGFAGVALGLIGRINLVEATIEVVGVLDDAPADTLELVDPTLCGLRFLGPVSALAQVHADGFIATVGYPAGRRAVAEQAGSLPPTPAMVDPQVARGRDVELGAGTLVSMQAVLGSGTVVGRHVYVSWATVIGPRCRIGDFVSVMSGVCLGDRVEVGAGATVGAGAIVADGCRIGEGATVGAGAVVGCDVAAGVTVVGAPARVLAR